MAFSILPILFCFVAYEDHEWDDETRNDECLSVSKDVDGDGTGEATCKDDLVVDYFSYWLDDSEEK